MHCICFKEIFTLCSLTSYKVKILPLIWPLTVFMNFKDLGQFRMEISNHFHGVPFASTSSGYLKYYLADEPGRTSSLLGTLSPETWWRHQMETFSALLAICAENSPVPGEFSTQRPVTRSFDVCFDLRPNKGLSKQLWGWWFETQSCPLWRHRNETQALPRPYGVIDMTGQKCVWRILCPIDKLLIRAENLWLRFVQNSIRL